MTKNETLKIEQLHNGRWQLFAESANGFTVLCEVSTREEAERRLARMIAAEAEAARFARTESRRHLADGLR